MTSDDRSADRGPHQLFFDLWSRVYDLGAVQRAVYRPVHDAALREVRGLSARRVLDVGCGTGILTERLARDLEPTPVCGCDISLGMLRQAAARRTSCWVQADAEELPLSRSSVDVVVSTDAFHWFPDPDAVLAEFRRVLAPGGRLVVGQATMRTASLARIARAVTTALGEPAQWTTRGEMRRRVERAGFRILSQRRVARVGGVALPTALTVAARNGGEVDGP